MSSVTNKSFFNTSFAEKDVIYSDGQINVMPLPEAIMANGFIPETRDAPGMPLAAQHLNWLFRDLYRRANQLDQLLPAWAPIACPMTQPPAGFLKCNGAVFDKDKYPELAKGYPSGVLPDLRGEFIRGWDDGRGVDAGRGLLTFQEGTIISGFDDNGNGDISSLSDPSIAFGDTLSITQWNSIKNKKWISPAPVGTQLYDWWAYTSSRPRNVAFLYIVRAA